MSGSSASETLQATVGGSIGFLILIGLFVFVWCFFSKRRGPKESNVRCPPNSVTEQEVDPPSNRRRQTEDKAEEDSLHYEEINFPKLRPKVSIKMEEEETVYSQVKVNRPEDANNLYANIKR